MLPVRPPSSCPDSREAEQGSFQIALCEERRHFKRAFSFVLLSELFGLPVSSFLPSEGWGTADLDADAAAPQSLPVTHILFLIVAVNMSCCRLVATKACSRRCWKSIIYLVFLKAFLKLVGCPGSFSLSTLQASTYLPRYVKLTFHTKRNHCFGR